MSDDHSQHPDLDARRVEFGDRLGTIEAKLDALRADMATALRLLAARAPLDTDTVRKIFRA
jgi:hypothetical protein